MSAVTEAEDAASLGDMQTLKAALDGLSEQDARLVWDRIPLKLPEFLVPQGLLAAYIFPSSLSICCVKPPSLQHCIAWYVIRTLAILERPFLTKEALETLTLGIRLSAGQKPSQSVDVDWSKIPTEVALLGGLYKLVASFASIRLRVDPSISFRDFAALSLENRFWLCLDSAKPLENLQQSFIESPQLNVPDVTLILQACSEITGLTAEVHENVHACIFPAISASADMCDWSFQRTLRSALSRPPSGIHPVELLKELIALFPDSCILARVLLEISATDSEPLVGQVREKIESVLREIKRLRSLESRQRFDDDLWSELSTQLSRLVQDLEISETLEYLLPGPPPSLRFFAECRVDKFHAQGILLDRLGLSKKLPEVPLEFFPALASALNLEISTVLPVYFRAHQTDEKAIRRGFAFWKSRTENSEKIETFVTNYLVDCQIKRPEEAEQYRKFLGAFNSEFPGLNQDRRLRDTNRVLEFFRILDSLREKRWFEQKFGSKTVSQWPISMVQISTLIKSHVPGQPAGPAATKLILSLFFWNPKIFEKEESRKLWEVVGIKTSEMEEDDPGHPKTLRSIALALSGKFNEALEISSRPNWRLVHSLIGRADPSLSRKFGELVVLKCPDEILLEICTGESGSPPSLEHATAWHATSRAVSSEREPRYRPAIETVPVSIARAVVGNFQLAEFLIPILTPEEIRSLPEVLSLGIAPLMSPDAQADLVREDRFKKISRFTGDIDKARFWRESAYRVLVLEGVGSKSAEFGLEQAISLFEAFGDLEDADVFETSLDAGNFLEDLPQFPDLTDSVAVENFIGFLTRPSLNKKTWKFHRALNSVAIRMIGRALKGGIFRILSFCSTRSETSQSFNPNSETFWSLSLMI